MKNVSLAILAFLLISAGNGCFENPYWQQSALSEDDSTLSDSHEVHQTDIPPSNRAAAIASEGTLLPDEKEIEPAENIQQERLVHPVLPSRDIQTKKMILPDFVFRPPDNVPDMPFSVVDERKFEHNARSEVLEARPEILEGVSVKLYPVEGKLKSRMPEDSPPQADADQTSGMNGINVPRSNSCNLIGSDDRVKIKDTTVSPYKTTIKMKMRYGDKTYGCSGIIIKNSWILTAAHCVYDHDVGDWADEIVVIPALNGSDEPFGRTYATHIYALTKWTRDKDYDYDIAIFTVADDLASATGTAGFGAFSDSTIKSYSLTATGYPYDYGSTTMVRSTGKTQKLTGNIICNTMDVCSGQSGSGVRITYNSGQYAVGTLSGNGGACDDYTKAVRITESIYDWIKKKMEECSCSSGVCCDGCDYRAKGRTCRSVDGDCDVAEYCTGSSSSCPSNKFKSSSTVCRGVAGDCDVAEYCTGSSSNCPPNKYKSSLTLCRAAEGDCDMAEYCTGSGSSCPSDKYKSSLSMCRAAAGDCDVAEYCNGYSRSCPNDSIMRNGVECRSARGSCDVAEFCDGESKYCPTDLIFGSGHLCRESSSPCDPAEYCTGESIHCPDNRLSQAGNACDDHNSGTTDDHCTQAGLCVGTEIGASGCSSSHATGGSIPLLFLGFVTALIFAFRRLRTIEAVSGRN